METNTPVLDAKVSYVKSRDVYRLRVSRGNGTVQNRVFPSESDAKEYLRTTFLPEWTEVLTSLRESLLDQLSEQSSLGDSTLVQLTVRWNSEQVSLGLLPREKCPKYRDLFQRYSLHPTLSLFLFPLLPKNHASSWWNPKFRKEQVLPRLHAAGVPLLVLLPLVKPLEHISDAGTRTQVYLDTLDEVVSESGEEFWRQERGQ